MKSFGSNVCLLISDSVKDREVFGRALRDVSPETVYCVATNGQEALDMIMETHLIPDIIFIELNLPNMDAVEFLKRLKDQPLYKNIPVIVHTRWSEPCRHPEILKAGALAIYSKKYEYEGVFNILYLYSFQEMALLHLN